MVDITNEINNTETQKSETEKNNSGLKFFKSCSATLKRFSVLMFVINIFLAVVIAIVGVILIAAYVGVEMLSLLAIPIICALIILIVLSRLVSALIYGFAEIVEKYEKK